MTEGVSKATENDLNFFQVSTKENEGVKGVMASLAMSP